MNISPYFSQNRELIAHYLNKKGGKWVSLYCTVSHKWITVLDRVKFEFNGINNIIVYEKRY